MGRPYSVAVMPLSHWFVKLGKVFFRVVCKQIICSQVVRIADTSDETFEALMAFGKAMKKVTVSCKVWMWGHMTLSQCTLLVTWPITRSTFFLTVWSCDLVGECMTFWGKCEQAGYVEFARKRLTLVTMVPYNWLGHSCLIADGEVCSFMFIIVLLRGGLRTTVASSPGPSLPPRGAWGTRLKTTDAMQYVKHLLLGVPVVCTLTPLQDTPGFIVNRLLVPYMAEAVRMLERGAWMLPMILYAVQSWME